MLYPPNYDVNDLRGDPNKLGAVPEGMTTVDNKLPGQELAMSPNLWYENPGGQLTSLSTMIPATVLLPRAR